MSGFVVDPLSQDSTQEQHLASPSAGQQKHEVVVVNRAPVLTLWSAVVAERQGHNWDESLSYGRAVASICAQSKGRSIGVIEDTEEKDTEHADKKRKTKHQDRVKVFGMNLPVKSVDGNLMATQKDSPVKASTVEQYIRRAFGDQYDRVKDVMQQLAAQFSPPDLDAQGYKLYEKFRPNIASGRAGWGQRGVLDLDILKNLTQDLQAANEDEED
eukprot:jgi/Chrzof1/8621/Cz03g17200.t1